MSNDEILERAFRRSREITDRFIEEEAEIARRLKRAAYKQFAITVAVAVVLLSLAALLS